MEKSSRRATRARYVSPMETNPFRAARGRDGRRAHAGDASPPEPDGASSSRPRRVSAWSLPGAVARLRADVAASAPAHPWLPRALLLPVMGWVLWNVLTGRAHDGPLHEPFGSLTLVVHEAGHAAFSWLGSPFLTAAGGTVFQLAVPALVAWLFARQREWMGVAVGLFWLGTSLRGAGVYAADALVQVLPRVSPWGGAEDVLSHDWTYMLLRVGRISKAGALGEAMQAAGTLVMAGALVFGAWVASVMAGATPATPPAGTTRRSPWIQR